MSLANSNINQASALDCIARFTKEVYTCGSLITFVDTANLINPQLIISLNIIPCYTFLSRSIDNQHKWWTITQQKQTEIIIISSSDVDEFTSTINELAIEGWWNPRARFILIMAEFKKEDILIIFEVLLSHNVFDVFLIKEENKKSIKVYRYYPFDNKKCGHVDNGVIEAEDCNNINYSVAYDYKILESKFQNCSLVIAAYDDVIHFMFSTNQEFLHLGNNTEGIEQYMFRNIAELENLNLEYIREGKELGYGIMFPNHTFSGILSYLRNNTASIAAGGFSLIENRAELNNFVWGYNYGSFYLFTPTVRSENWKKIYHEFSFTTWILIVLSSSFTMTAVASVRKYMLGKEDQKKVSMFKLLGYLYGQSDSNLFEVKKTRVIIILWIWFTFFITSFYNTAFYSLLTGKDFIPKLDIEMNNLRSVPYKPCFTDNIRIFYKFNYNDTLPGERSKECKYSTVGLDSVANSTDLFTIQLEQTYKLREYRYIDENGNHKLQKWKFSDDLDIIIAFYTKRGFPLREKLQRYVRYHFESGLIQKHLRIIFHSTEIIYNKQKSNYRNSRLSDYKVHFSVLCIGYLISIVCFILEMSKRSR